MKKKFVFSPKKPEDFISEKGKRYMFNFENMNGLYYFHNLNEFKEAVSSKSSLNFIDSAILFFWAKLKNKKDIARNRGADFTRRFLSNSSSKDKHFFIGLEKKELPKILEEFPNLSFENLKAHNPSFVKGYLFDKKEVDKIAKAINKSKPDYVWVCVGSPKQSILSAQLFNKTTAKYFSNIGGAIDFITEKKKEAPKLFQKIGLEWLYRLITDFRHSGKKVNRSFIAIKHLGSVEIK